MLFRSAKALERDDIAGKTGTTNDQVDAWFNGYHESVAASAWVGLDNPETLGRREYGGAAALPIWIDFMRVALKGQPIVPLEPTAGVVQVRVDPQTGQAVNGRNEGIKEWFLAEGAPQQETAQTEEQSAAAKRARGPSVKDAASLF